MAISDLQFAEWMQGGNRRCLLADTSYKHPVSGVVYPLYFSNMEYATEPSDTPANTSYEPVISSGLDISKSISIEGSSNSQFGWGSLQLNNIDGRLEWLMSPVISTSVIADKKLPIFKNQKITLLLGDPSWPKSDFRVVFDGIVNDFNISGLHAIDIIFKDKSELLNTPTVGTTFDDLYFNTFGYRLNSPDPIVYPPPAIHPRLGEKDNVLPILFGDCFNISPVSIDYLISNTKDLWFMVHNGPIEAITCVKDNGAKFGSTVISTTSVTIASVSYSMINYGTGSVIEYSVVPALGLLKLNKSVFGSLTCDVLGARLRYKIVSPGTLVDLGTNPAAWEYKNDIANIVLNLCMSYGIIASRLVVGDINVQDFWNFMENPHNISNSSSTNPLIRYRAVGVYARDKQNVSEVINNIVSSNSGVYWFDQLGKLVLSYLPESYIADAGYTIHTYDIVKGSLSIDQSSSPSSACVKLGYGKNYSVTDRQSLAGIVDPVLKEALGKELGEVLVTNTYAVTSYGLPSTAPSVESTMLVDIADATAEANYRLFRRSNRLFSIKLSLVPEHYNLDIGDVITLNYFRYSISNIPCLIVGKDYNLVSSKYTYRVIYYLP